MHTWREAEQEDFLDLEDMFCFHSVLLGIQKNRIHIQAVLNSFMQCYFVILHWDDKFHIHHSAAHH